MNVTLIRPDDSAYPDLIGEKLGDRPPIATFGNLGLLQSRPLALFCSIKCPGDVILRTYDLIRSIRDAGIPMIGGFHSPMEKECLSLLLRGAQPIIVCPARSIEGMQLPASWQNPLAEARLLILSPFAEKHRRVTAEMSETRNLFVAAIAEQILVAHAAPDSKTERFFRELLSWGKRIWTLASKENERLVTSGARELRPEEVVGLAKQFSKNVNDGKG